MEASVVTTYRCTNKCEMCHIWKYPTKEEEEFKASLLEKLPHLSFCNVTGGEPFLRDDIHEIVHILRRKADRIVISTNGYLVERILDLAKQNRNIGIRISIEGLRVKNDEIRGMRGSFDHALRTLLELKRMGLKDIGFATTVSDRNARDMIEVYQLARSLNVEFSTIVAHNSYYFHKYDNRIVNKEEVINCFEELIHELIRTWRIKNWYRAYFNSGLIDYIQRKPRPFSCTAGMETFFLDPWGEMRPCNGMEESLWFASMGNLHEQPFEQIWSSDKANKIREMVRHCPKNCWMLCTVGPMMKKRIWKPTLWVLRKKLGSLLKKERGI